MSDAFRRGVDRLSSDSKKWHLNPPDVLPLGLADMDFPSSDAVIQALVSRARHGVLGYPTDPSELRDVIVDRMRTRYSWQISRADILFLPCIDVGLSLACHGMSSRRRTLVICPPVYHSIRDLPGETGMEAIEVPLLHDRSEQYALDMPRLGEALAHGPAILVLCNPHNPVGRVFTVDELEDLARLCLANDVLVCSDEIHCDLVFDGRRHVPLAALEPELAARMVTLMSPSKGFNLSGLRFGFAIVQDPDLRRQVQEAHRGLVAGGNVMGYAAALAAYRDSDEWLVAALSTLERNRDALSEYVRNELRPMTMCPVEGTYLAWLDCRRISVPGNAHAFFLNQARVALSNGADFGPGGDGFVRLNFACTPDTLELALGRMKEALART
ncbi:MAG: PatB family C-S lyase [Thermotogota bacterium]